MRDIDFILTGRYDQAESMQGIPVLETQPKIAWILGIVGDFFSKNTQKTRRKKTKKKKALYLQGLRGGPM